MSTKKIMIESFVLAFIVSFFTIIVVYPQSMNVLYTNIAWWSLEVSSSFLLKVVIVLVWQTSALGSVFYVLAKKIFIK